MPRLSIPQWVAPILVYVLVTLHLHSGGVVEAKLSFREIQLQRELLHINAVFGDPDDVVVSTAEIFGFDATTTVRDENEEVVQADSLNLGIAYTTTPTTTSTSTPRPIPSVLYPGNVTLPINHNGPSPPPYTFQNRFWVLDTFWRPGGPVFVFDTGESPGGFVYSQYITNSSSFFNQYLREFNGLGILWEHRYYGESAPWKIELNTTSERMKYLTTENALLDFVRFAEKFRWRVGGPDARNSGEEGGLVGQVVDFNPKKAPWVVVGGSYPGMRAAMLRDRFPETVFAAYASSAPVQASTNMTVYWDQVHRGLIRYGYKNCTQNIHLAISYIDAQLSTPSNSSIIKQFFLGRTAERNSNAAFSDTLFYPLNNWQSFGVDKVLAEFCDVLEFGSESDRREKSGEVLAERWARWPMFAELVNTNHQNGYCEGSVTRPELNPDCRLGDRIERMLGISWMWQYCTEWGFFQASNLGPDSLGSKFNTLSYQQDQCYRQFPDGLSSGHLPSSPLTNSTNARYGGWLMNPSNVFWTGGEFDPWRTLSPLSSEEFSPKLTWTEKIPRCNVRRGKGQGGDEEPLFGVVLGDAQHVYDFDPKEQYPAAERPQRLFAEALREWLPCFYGK